MRNPWALPLLAACLWIAGCWSPKTEPPRSQPPRSQPPPRTLDEIIALVNANADRIDRPLYDSTVHVVARFVDEEGRQHHFNFDGILLISKPQDLYLELKHPLGEPVIRVGSNDDDYWVWIRPELSTFWWGRHRHVGKPCADPVPLRPDQIVPALGLHQLPFGSADLIGPARLYGEEFDRLLYLRPDGAGRYEIDREYWVERNSPYMIRLIMFRDTMGRRAMNAHLDDYRPAWDDGPLVPHRVSIFWPTDDGRLLLSMDRLRVPEKISPQSFVRPTEAPAGIEKTVQVDRSCDEVEEFLSAPEDTEPTADQPADSSSTNN
jgi:hypothetical protein